MKQIKFTYTHEGAPVADSAWLVHRGPRVVIIDIDMASKYCRIEASTGNGVMIAAGKHSMHLKEGVDRDLATIITFDLPGEWVFIASSGGRYALTCVFLRAYTTVWDRARDRLDAIGWNISKWWHQLLGGGG